MDIMDLTWEDYLEKVYAGLLGKIAGVRLGAPVEASVWTYDKIKTVYGDINGYLKEYKNFAADDDINGPVFFIRALYDVDNGEITADDVGKAWLNYTREGIGMFWWGGYGISTEHTAYLNMKNGLSAPMSGSAKQNGFTLAEQIGGQIFVDTWGLVNPGNYTKAAEYGKTAASVSHDGNGVIGAEFMTACISKAFFTEDIKEIINAGLSVIPKDSTYAKVIGSVVEFNKDHPDDFRQCRDYLEREWGYDRYPGVCHIIPNAGVCVLALLYGNGDFSRTIEIATMCGWDTDCNAGNVGTIMGVAKGINSIPDSYRAPINDAVVASSISGYLNIIDVPSYAKEIASLGYKLNNQSPPQQLVNNFRKDEFYFDFDLPGSTHGFRLSNTNKFRISHSNEITYDGNGSLEVLYDRIKSGQSTKVYYKPFYRRDDFDDEKYKPTFAPKVYPGQHVSLKVYLDQWNGNGIMIAPYIRDTYTKKEIKLEYRRINDKNWNDLDFDIPDTFGSMIDEVGIFVESFSNSDETDFGRLFIDNFHVSGKSHYRIDFSKQVEEFMCVTPFAHNHGSWSIEGNKMQCICSDKCEAYTGNYYAKDIKIRATVNPQNGFSHNIAFRAQGAMKGYHVGFSGKDEVSLVINNFGFKPFMTVPYKWEHNAEYLFEIVVKGNRIVFYINGQKVLEYEDNQFTFGMYGFSMLSYGRTYFSNIEIEEL